MKTTKIKYGLAAVCAAVLTASAAFRASADQSATAVGPEENFSGTVTAVSAHNHTLSVQGWMLSNKSFYLGDNCTYKLLDGNNGTIDDLRPGEKVTVSYYQDKNGVPIADKVKQDPMEFEGQAKTIDTTNQTPTLPRTALDQKSQDSSRLFTQSHSGG